MRRLIWIWVIVMLMACGGGKEDATNNKPLPPTATRFVQPTLPPLMTIDPFHTPPTRTPDNTRGRATATRTRPISRGPTLPPLVTIVNNVVGDIDQPTITPSPAFTPRQVPTEPDYCTTFRPDVEANRENSKVLQGEAVTIGWQRVELAGILYRVQLFSQSQIVVLEATELAQPRYTFPGDILNGRGVYYWQVTAYQNGQLLNCVPLDGEITVN